MLRNKRHKHFHKGQPLMNKDLPLNPFRTSQLHNIFRFIMNGKKCMTHKMRGRFLLWSDKNYWDARKIIDPPWHLHFAELLEGEKIDQNLPPTILFRIYLSLSKALIISGRKKILFFLYYARECKENEKHYHSAVYFTDTR